MDELIATFHLDWHLLLAQLVNFAIVFFVLWRFALRPLMKTMAERTATIEKSLHDAEEIEKTRKATDEEMRLRLKAAQEEALMVISESKRQAEEQRQQMLVKAKKEVEGVIKDAKVQIAGEKEQMLSEARAELADLVAQGISRVMEKNHDDKADKKIIAGIVKKL